MCCPASPPFDLDSLWLAQIPSWLFLPCINSKCVLVIKANFSLPSTLWSEKAAVNRCAPYDSSLLAFCSLKVNGQGCTFGKLGLQHSPEIFVQGGGLRGCGEGVDGLWSGMVTLYRENDAFWKKKMGHWKSPAMRGSRTVAFFQPPSCTEFLLPVPCWRPRVPERTCGDNLVPVHASLAIYLKLTIGFLPFTSRFPNLESLRLDFLLGWKSS